jgi:hypothetical protein
MTALPICINEVLEAVGPSIIAPRGPFVVIVIWYGPGLENFVSGKFSRPTCLISYYPDRTSTSIAPL